MRRFEFEEGTSSKFWEIERRARTVTVTFGRIGSKGQEKAKSFGSDADAAHEEEKLIAEKLRKGYREVTGGKPAPAPTAPPKKAAAAPAKKRATAAPAGGQPARRDDAAAATGDLFFTDPFALTRVAADDRVRSVGKFAARLFSVDAEAKLGFVVKPDGVRLLVDLAKLKELAAMNEGTVLHPTGTAVITLGSDPAAFIVTRLKDGVPAKKTVTRQLTFDKKSARDPLRLGEEPGPYLACDQPLVFDTGGRFLAFVVKYWWQGAGPRVPGVLVAGSFPDPGGEPAVDWRLDLSGPVDGTVALSIVDGIGALFVRDVVAGAIDVVLLGEGAPRVRRINSVTVPARVGQTIVYQPDAATVVREPLAGGEGTRHALSAEQAGPGRIATNGSRWLFLPRYAEVALDLERGVTIDRGLPRAEAEARAAALAMLRKYEPFAASAKMDIEISKLDLRYGETRFWFSPGRPGLAQAALWGLGHRIGHDERQSFGYDGGPGQSDRPLTGPQIVEILRFFQAQRLPLDAASMFWDDLHGRSPHYHLSEVKERALVEPDGAAILVRAMMDAVSPAPGTYETKLAEWTAKGDLSPEEVTATLQQMSPEVLAKGKGEYGTGIEDLFEPTSWLLFNRFGRDVLRIWFAVPPDQLAFMKVGKPMERLAKTDPAARKQIVEWFGGFDHSGGEWLDVSFELRAEFPDKTAAEDKPDDEDDEVDDDEPIPPPRGFDKPTSWEAIAKAWASARSNPDGETAPRDPAAVAKALGVPRLPPSYLTFIERFEALGELMLRYQREKDDFPNYLNITPPERLERYRDDFIKLLDSFADTSVQMRQRAKDLRGLLPFGSDTSRTDICWDPSKTSPEGEMAICFYNHEYDRRVEAGFDLKEIVKYFRPGSLSRYAR